MRTTRRNGITVGRCIECRARSPTIGTMDAPSISHDRGEEDILAKARWFSQFTPEERLRMLIEWADAMLALNPAIEDKDRASPVAGRIQVLARP